MFNGPCAGRENRAVGGMIKEGEWRGGLEMRLAVVGWLDTWSESLRFQAWFVCREFCRYGTLNSGLSNLVL